MTSGDPSGAAGGGTRARPSAWVERFYWGIKPGGRVLDVACGAGRHIPLALASGRSVVGIDRDVSAALAEFGTVPGVTLITADLEDGRPFPLTAERFDGVIVTNYLWRPILPAIVSAVAPGGVLIYETFGVGQRAFGRPSNPNFLLQPGELLSVVEGRLRVIAFEEVRLAEPDRVVQRIAAVGFEHRWPLADTPVA